MTETFHTNLNISIGPVPGEDDVAHAQRLRADGLKVVDIAKELHISERGAYRLLAAGRERVRHSDIEAWTITTSVEDGDPPEKVRYLFEMPESIRWRRRDAEFAWALHQLKPELPTELVSAFASMYVAVSQHRGRTRDRWSKILDLALALEPWTDEENEDRFFQDVNVPGGEDLEFAARVISYLEETAMAERVVLQSVPPVPDQVVWIRERVRQLAQETQIGRDVPQVIEIPGDVDMKKERMS